MTLPVELETSVNQLRAKHTALIDAVNAYRSGTVNASKQELLTLADDIDKQLTVEEHTLLGQVARKGRMPSLLLDFANGKYAVGGRRLERFTSLEDILTFSRSTGGGRFNAQGQYEWVGPDVPRIDYDPVTGECLGLLVEPQRTNLRTYSGDPSKWGNTTGFQEVSVPNPLGAPTVQKLMATGSGSNSVLDDFQQPASITHARTYILKPDGISRVAFGRGVSDASRPAQVNLVSGEVRQNNDVWNVQSVVPLTTDGWVAITVTAGPDLSTGRYCRIYLVGDDAPLDARHTDLAFEGDENSGVLILAGQVEQGAFPTSYIPTNGSAVTRAADEAQRVFGDELAKNSGTLVYEAAIGPAHNSVTGARKAPYSLESTAHYTTASLHRQDEHSRFVGYDGVGSNSLTVLYDAQTSWEIGKPGVIAHAWEHRPTDNKRKTAISIGGAIATIQGEYSVEVSKIDRISVQAGTTQHISRIAYYPFAMTESQLQELTQ